MAMFNVGGFSFSDEESAKAAAKELKAVDYILGQLKDADSATVLKVYNQLLDKRMFSTQVGLSFLDQLRTNLVDSGEVSEDNIRLVDGSYPSKKIIKKSESTDAIKVNNKSKGSTKVTQQARKESINAEIKRLKRINNVLIVICITLILCICGMFYVNSTINSPNILNYEEQILDKYSTWEQELSEREDALREKERE